MLLSINEKCLTMMLALASVCEGGLGCVSMIIGLKDLLDVWQGCGSIVLAHAWKLSRRLRCECAVVFGEVIIQWH